MKSVIVFALVCSTISCQQLSNFCERCVRGRDTFVQTWALYAMESAFCTNDASGFRLGQVVVGVANSQHECEKFKGGMGLTHSPIWVDLMNSTSLQHIEELIKQAHPDSAVPNCLFTLLWAAISLLAYWFGAYLKNISLTSVFQFLFRRRVDPTV